MKKIATFIATALLAGGLSMAWEPFFSLFVYDEGFLGFWLLCAVITVAALHLSTASWRLALGRSLAFAAGIGALGGLGIMMTAGPAEASIPLVIALAAFGASWPLTNHVVRSDPQALAQLAETSKHLAGFPAFYSGEVQEWMHAQETRRKNAVRRMWIGLCFAIPAAAIVMGAADFYIIPDTVNDEGECWWDWVVFGVWLAAICAGAGVSCLPAWDLKDEMKEKLLKRLISYFGDLKHQEDMKFDAKKFREAGLVGAFNREDTDDGFTGTHGHVGFELAEVDLEYETGSGKNRRTEQVFDGLMIVMNFPLPFQGKTLVLRDQGKFGNWIKDKISGLERVNLNIKQFEDRFEVYSTDQIEARAILTPDLMENVIKLGVLFSGKKYDRLKEKDEYAAAVGNVQLAFEDSSLMITIATGKDLFEVGHLDASMEDTARIAQFAREVGIIYEIIDTLELNRKAETFAVLKA